MANAKRRWPLVVGIVAGVVALLLVAAGVTFFAMYVHDTDIDQPGASREFAAARTRFAGQAPLVEYGGLQPSVVHRSSGDRRQLAGLHALVYDATDGYLRRVDVPIGLLRAATIGGRFRLGNLGITLEDLERHGPGLVFDTNGAAAGTLSMVDGLIGTHSNESQILIWTD